MYFIYFILYFLAAGLILHCARLRLIYQFRKLAQGNEFLRFDYGPEARWLNEQGYWIQYSESRIIFALFWPITLSIWLLINLVKEIFWVLNYSIKLISFGLVKVFQL